MVQYVQIIKCNTAYYQKQRQKHHEISIATEKTFYKIQHPFMMKALMELGIEGMYLNIVKTIYDKPTAKIKLNREELKPFPLKSGMRQGYL
jgi:hypothetical protein